MTLHANPMIIIYLNDYNKENHAAPPAYLFFLKLFSSLSYPMLTFNYFHPFYPAVSFTEKNSLFSFDREISFHRTFRICDSSSWLRPIAKKLERWFRWWNVMIGMPFRWSSIRVYLEKKNFSPSSANITTNEETSLFSRNRHPRVLSEWNMFTFSKRSSFADRVHLKGQRK